MPEPAARCDDPSPHTVRILHGLRTFGAQYTEFTGRFAAWLGLHSTDAAALAEILYAEDQGAPLSPTRLGRRLSLSSGATTNLLNRLEGLGFIVRSRESADRRAVTLRSSREIEAPARRFFGPMADTMDSLTARYSTEQLEQFGSFLGDLGATMTALLAEPPPPRHEDG